MRTDSFCSVTEDVLENYAWERLPEPDRATLEEHLLICAHCQARLEQIDDYLPVARAATAALVADPPASSAKSIRKILNIPSIPNPLWAAGVAAIFLILTIPWAGGPRSLTEVDLQTTRAIAPFPLARADHSVLFRIDVAQLPQADVYQLEVVDPFGHQVWRALAEAGRDQITATLRKGLPAGRYWIRLYDAGQPWVLLREYGLDVQ